MLKAMKTNISVLGLIPVIAICLSFLSCHNNLDTSSDFIIRVDSVKIPNAVSSTTPFDIVFFGTIGFNCCYSFKTFNRVVKDNDIKIEAWGTLDYKEGKCPEGLVSLNGQILKLTIPLTGTYRIVIKEPEDYTLVKQITVK
jgi:hypothetical protein